jgi:hypothetical protein
MVKVSLMMMVHYSQDITLSTYVFSLRMRTLSFGLPSLRAFLPFRNSIAELLVMSLSTQAQMNWSCVCRTRAIVGWAVSAEAKQSRRMVWSVARVSSPRRGGTLPQPPRPRVPTTPTRERTKGLPVCGRSAPATVGAPLT